MRLGRYKKNLAAMELHEIVNILRSSDAVCFDVDSTVCTGEGIDDLAAFKGVGNAVADLTNQAMSEGYSFREALHKRLCIIQPSATTLKEFLDANPPSLTPNVKELVQQLQSRNKQVFLVSGGFRSLIEPVADILGIPKKNIFANRLIFSNDGSYTGFDENEPTSSSGGKKVVLENLKRDYNFQKMIMIGDGMTDMEAFPPADLFIGFGGNKIRENVRKNAPWFITDFRELIKCFST